MRRLKCYKNIWKIEENVFRLYVHAISEQLPASDIASLSRNVKKLLIDHKTKYWAETKNIGTVKKTIKSGGIEQGNVVGVGMYPIVSPETQET